MFPQAACCMLRIKGRSWQQLCHVIRTWPSKQKTGIQLNFCSFQWPLILLSSSCLHTAPLSSYFKQSHPCASTIVIKGKRKKECTWDVKWQVDPTGTVKVVVLHWLKHNDTSSLPKHLLAKCLASELCLPEISNTCSSQIHTDVWT